MKVMGARPGGKLEGNTRSADIDSNDDEDEDDEDDHNDIGTSS